MKSNANIGRMQRMSQLQAQDWHSEFLDVLERSANLLVVVLGPTASGKTGFSIHLAQSMKGKSSAAEIVNADSRQLYRHLDIGTAKIADTEKQGIPHHLLDVCDPAQEVTAAWYKEQAEKVIQEIHDRGNVPVLVGGSMLYISAVIDGLSFAPRAETEQRRTLEEAYDCDGGIALHARLAQYDSESALSIHPHNKPYVIRALEILEQTGVPASKLKYQQECPYDLFILGMQWPREELHARINTRVAKMFEAGWIEEVEGLLALGYHPEHPAMKSHGYREVVAYLEGDIDDLPKLQELIAAKSRQYAKRQLTWWRSDPRIRWVMPA